MRYFIPFISLSLVFQGCGNEESLAKEETSETRSSTKVDGPARGDSQNVPRPHDNRNSNLSPGLNPQAAEPAAQAVVSRAIPTAPAPRVIAPQVHRDILPPLVNRQIPQPVVHREIPQSVVHREIPPSAPRVIPSPPAPRVIPSPPAPRPEPVEQVVELAPGTSVTVRGSIFQSGNRNTNFSWMIDQPQYARTLFVFNDNEGQFDAFMNGDRGPTACGAGGNNGAIRPYQCRDPPIAAGVPTGPYWASLTPPVRAKINQAIGRIRGLAMSGNFDTIVFSQTAEAGPPTLGIGIFAVGMDVRNYIFESLLRLNPGA
jgi:hypothetical protein